MRSLRILTANFLLCLVVISSPLRADEGMWLYNAFPKERVKAKYGFEITQAWLDHVRLSSVRFSNGGSGSFVSANGLTFTNHHVAADCIHDLSINGKDYMKNGFYAPAAAQEARCPNLAADQLVGIDDVTSKVNAAVKPAMSAAEMSQVQRAAISNVEKACAVSPEIRCEVVALFSGAVYDLYKYKRYADVRLVFAPEFAAAFFGGDPDNFTYPRYDLDIAFLRVYENSKPAHLDNYLHWSPAGVTDKALVFVSGNPGSTSRWKTMAQLYFLRDVDYPSRLETHQRWDTVLDKFASESPENARIAQEYIYGSKNAFKAISGYQAGLENKALMARKAAQEDKLQTAYLAKHPNQPDPWQNIAQAMKVEAEIYDTYNYLERMRGFASPLAQYARALARAAEERTKPNGERLREYRDSSLPYLEQELSSPTPIYRSLETFVLTESFRQMQQALGADNADVKKILAGRTPDEAAKSMIEGTRLDDAAFRKQLYQGGEPALEACTDPLIKVMRLIDPDARAARKRYEDEVEAVERSEGAKITQAVFSEYGFTEPPDATSSLRLSYGMVKGYVENGRPVSYFTDIRGAFHHAAEHNNQPPFQLPASWISAKSGLALATPLNFVSTADVLGGNSGSPTINQTGEVVGVIFDANIQALASNFVYSDETARAISVDVRSIREALTKIYGATALANELSTGGNVTSMPSK
jgi:Peptidase S46